MQITIWRQLGGMGYIGNPFFTGLGETGVHRESLFPGIEGKRACITNHPLAEIGGNGLHRESYNANSASILFLRMAGETETNGRILCLCSCSKDL